MQECVSGIILRPAGNPEKGSRLVFFICPSSVLDAHAFESHSALKSGTPQSFRDLDRAPDASRVDSSHCGLFDDSADQYRQFRRSVKHQYSVIGE